jgi:tryptophanyl-tRNA synthetase
VTTTTAVPHPTTTSTDAHDAPPGRTLSGFKPTGPLHLGNLLSALRPLAAAGRPGAPDRVLAMVADLHAVTVPHDPGRLRQRTREVAALALAAGVDPHRCTLFVQSHVDAHRKLHFLLEAVARVGEASRMVQYKEKSRAGAGDGVRLALLTYPVLMAADILLYDVDAVPVGEDQDQHLQLARTLAHRANRLYGAGLVVPRAVQPAAGVRLMDLQDPTTKMEKTNVSLAGVLLVLDPPDVLARKVSRAVTDTETGPGSVRYDRAAKPGVSNLLDLLAACTGVDPQYAARGIDSYRELKEAVTSTVVETLRPVQERYAEIASDTAALDRVLEDGAERARVLAEPVVRRVEDRMGLTR